MPTKTDPAKELAELCESLVTDVNLRGYDYLAERFGVPAWSKDFYQILFAILKRIDEVESLIDRLEADVDIKAERRGNLAAIRSAFAQESLYTNWKAPNGPYQLRAENSAPIKSLSPAIRKLAVVPKLSDQELQELLVDVEELLSWLRGHQLSDHDFIRQALIDGLTSFQFTAKHLRWVGWGYCINSLREVIGAYMALERGQNLANENAIYSAMQKKVQEFIGRAYRKLSAFRELTETGDFILRAYGACSAIRDSATIAGLLPGS